MNESGLSDIILLDACRLYVLAQKEFRYFVKLTSSNVPQYWSIRKTRCRYSK